MCITDRDWFDSMRSQGEKAKNMNSWIFQANPQVFMIDWFLDEYASNNPNDKDWWIIHKKHQGFITPYEDEVYIWKAASEPSKREFNDYFKWKESIGRSGKSSGIFAKGEIISYPEPFFETNEEREKFKKYRAIDSYSFTSKNLMVKCVYKNSENIRVRKPLLKDTILLEINKDSDTELGSFLRSPRKRYSIKLTPYEAEIIRSLFTARQ